jgi:hypothetical protein
MSPNTTPSAAKLKPAAPIAETELCFSVESLATRLSMTYKIAMPTPDRGLGSKCDHLSLSGAVNVGAS